MNGNILPHSNKQISMSFHAQESICINANLICNIFHGPSEYINITARADNIKYLLNKTQIDFGRQVNFYESKTIYKIN